MCRQLTHLPMSAIIRCTTFSRSYVLDLKLVNDEAKYFRSGFGFIYRNFRIKHFGCLNRPVLTLEYPSSTSFEIMPKLTISRPPAETWLGIQGWSSNNTGLFFNCSASGPIFQTFRADLLNPSLSLRSRAGSR